MTHTGLVMGSPGFMSPEQAEGRVVGPPSDVFSLGAVLTFAATGEGPFGTGSTAALVYRVVHSPPGLEQVPVQVRAVIERCLAKDPGQRPAPADLLAELGAAHLAADWLPVPIIEGFAGAPADPPNGLATVTSAGPARHHEPVPAPPGPALPQPGSDNDQSPHRIRRATSTDPGQSPLPAGATILGGVDLGRYCAQSGLYAVLRFPNTFGWRCSTSPASASGNRLGDQNINVLAACIQQYGTGAASHYSSYTNPDSWFCYR